MHDFNKPRCNFDALASQLFPYPDHPILKWTFRLPILFHRLGLGLIVGRLFMILTTIGRKSGLPRHSAIEFHSEVGVAARSRVGGDRRRCAAPTRCAPDTQLLGRCLQTTSE